MMEHPPQRRPSSEIILYQTEDGRTRISVRLENETVWLTQAAMAELFQMTPQNITSHVKGIYEDGELDESATCKEYLQVRTEGIRQVQRRLKSIYESGELEWAATVANFATVRTEGSWPVQRDLKHYNLDAVISVGYRVNSIRGEKGTEPILFGTQVAHAVFRPKGPVDLGRAREGPVWVAPRRSPSGATDGFGCVYRPAGALEF